ncbi:MAG: hypothetical protein ACKO9U_11765 [Dolichospermum sp.]
MTVSSLSTVVSAVGSTVTVAVDDPAAKVTVSVVPAVAVFCSENSCC